jgi:succinate dehydrogenase / fumarate reductase, cytochrome b subunit
MQLSSWRRLHSASGLLPLGVYLLFHAFEHWPIRAGRDALFARLSHTTSAPLESLLVLAPLVLHAGLGVWLAGRDRDSGPYASPAFRRLQLVSGLVAAVFLVHHVSGVWLPRVREPFALGAAYGATLAHTGQVGGVLIYVLGTAAVCTHFGQGLGVALTRLLPRRVRPTPARVIGALLGILLWLSFMNELATYATSAPFV